MYEWLPTSIVIATFLFGILAEAIESGRLTAWTTKA